MWVLPAYGGFAVLLSMPTSNTEAVGENQTADLRKKERGETYAIQTHETLSSTRLSRIGGTGETVLCKASAFASGSYPLRNRAWLWQAMAAGEPPVPAGAPVLCGVLEGRTAEVHQGNRG